MNARVLACLAAVLPAFGQVHFSSGETVLITIDGNPFTEFHPGSDVGKPFLAPLRSPSGKIVTRHYPMEKIEGESRDHPHHRGLWFSYDDVNGIKFWENDPSYTKPNIGHIIVRDVKRQDGAKSGTLTLLADWKAPDGTVELVEDRKMTFYSGAGPRIVDFDITLTAPNPVVFGDTKEGAFAIRLADSMIEKEGWPDGERRRPDRHG